MKTGKVIGNIWATRKEERLSGMKLLIVQPFNPADDTEIEIGRASCRERVLFRV